MKKDEVPQDEGTLSKNSIREVVYATDETGNYTTALSTGWEPKSIALSNSLEDINERIAAAKEAVANGKLSPIGYFMELNRMDLGILSSYARIWKWRVKRHFEPMNFRKLNERTLKKYADAFNISVHELKNFSGK